MFFLECTRFLKIIMLCSLVTCYNGVFRGGSMTERTQTTHTFNVSNHDKLNTELMVEIKERCKKQGVSFTWYCLQAIKIYEETTNGG